MKDEVLTILIVNYNTSDFIELSLYALKKLTKNRYKVIICDNGSINSDKKKIKKIANENSNVELLFRQQTGPAGIGHGEALNILIGKTDTKYGIFLDADTIFLKKDWDEILVSQLDNKIKIIGCPPVINPNKPIDFPSVYATLFDTKIFKSLKIDMRPKNYKIGQDTGWEMREKFLRNGYQSRILETRSTREYKKGPFRSVICTEYYLKGHDGIFACHFGRGATSGAGKYKDRNFLFKVPIVRHFMRNLKGKSEKKEWLTICRNIINNEDVY